MSNIFGFEKILTKCILQDCIEGEVIIVKVNNSALVFELLVDENLTSLGNI